MIISTRMVFADFDVIATDDAALEDALTALRRLDVDLRVAS